MEKPILEFGISRWMTLEICIHEDMHRLIHSSISPLEAR